MKAVSFPPIVDEPVARAGRAPVAEAAPARARVSTLAVIVAIVFCALAARAGQLAIWESKGPASDAPAPAAARFARADLVDRNGVLLATTIPAFTLVATPKTVWDAPAVARALAAHLPDMKASEIEAKLLQRDRDAVFIRRDLTAHQKEEIFRLGLPGITFRDQARRVYPQGDLAVHTLGGVNAAMVGDAGIELALDRQIRQSARADGALRLTLDVRIQHALETELARAVRLTDAKGGAGIVLDGRTGQVLAIASAPSFDANAPPSATDDRFRDRAVGSVYEMGSTIKPFTVAMALDGGLTSTSETFDLDRPLDVGGVTIEDFDKLGRGTSLPRALAESSNKVAATLALRVGADRQRAILAKLGMFEAAPVELPQSAKPLAPASADQVTTAVLGYGHGMAISLATLAGAYTVFANDGARVTPTLLMRADGDDVGKVQVFSPATTRAVLAMMRLTVVSGTGKGADRKRLDIAGKTGTAEKPRAGGYSSDRMFSSFAAIFPARDPHYVMVVALDEPRRVAAFGDKATGGAVAAPVAGRVAARIAPLLGVELSDGGESP